MRRILSIEIKIVHNKPKEKEQKKLYLRKIDRNKRQHEEQAPLGIILCAGKKRETVEYLDLDARGIHVAEYLTELPPREVLENRLHRAIEAARNGLSLRVDGSPVDSLPPTERRARSKKKTPRGRSR